MDMKTSHDMHKGLLAWVAVIGISHLFVSYRQNSEDKYVIKTIKCSFAVHINLIIVCICYRDFDS